MAPVPVADWFEDATVRLGVTFVHDPGPAADYTTPRVMGSGCAIFDADGDGRPDQLFLQGAGPGGARNVLYRQTEAGTFVDVSAGSGLDFTGQNTGIAVGDVDNDGLTDIFVTHLTTEMNTLWKQGPRGTFQDRTLAAGAVATKWRGTGFGTVMADFDRDGRADLALVNGRVSRDAKHTNALPAFWRDYGERNQLLRNVGGKFEDVSEANPVFCGTPNVGRGLAVGDIDGDGRPDLVVTAVAGPAKVYLNRCAPAKHWLAVRPLTSAGAPAHGAEVEVVAGGGKQVRTVQPADSYLCSSLPEVLFGPGDAVEVTSITVRWPDGTTESLPAGPADRRLTPRQATRK